MEPVMNESNDLSMLEVVERYIRGEMGSEERVHFENLRKTNGEIDQLVVEHTLFLQQLGRFGDRQEFQASLSEVHAELSGNGAIHADHLAGKAKVIYMWNRYKRVTAIAASIAVIVAVSTSSLFNRIVPAANEHKLQELTAVVDKVKEDADIIKVKQDNIEKKITGDVAASPTKPDIIAHFKGTGFLIDGKGLMITNAHVVKQSKNIFVQNNKGQNFKAIVLQLDVTRDVAIIKIDDENFRSPGVLPYGISRNTSPIAESIFTLGFPRSEIVYGEGYLSARTGYNGDTLSCQISVDANPGNSGGPVFNTNGEVIGILSSKEEATEGAVFAVQSKYIYQAVDQLRKNAIYDKVKLSSRSLISGMDKVQQVKKLEDYIYMVKADYYKPESK
ncbi:MAG: serine protease [Chitinophagaceae bacterium]|nr:MAG: serine protease [Chitinophagaceae bacterium]